MVVSVVNTAVFSSIWSSATTNPVIVSVLVAPPVVLKANVSLPAPPTSVSLPSLPSRTLTPALPVRVWAMVDPVRLIAPVPAAFVVSMNSMSLVAPRM